MNLEGNHRAGHFSNIIQTEEEKKIKIYRYRYILFFSLKSYERSFNLT